MVAVQLSIACDLVSRTVGSGQPLIKDGRLDSKERQGREPADSAHYQKHGPDPDHALSLTRERLSSGTCSRSLPPPPHQAGAPVERVGGGPRALATVLSGEKPAVAGVSVHGTIAPCDHCPNDAH